MFGLTPTQLWIGLAVLAAIIVVIIVAVVLVSLRSVSVSHEGGKLSVPRSLPTSGAPAKASVKIVIPKGYTYDQMAKLGELFGKKVDKRKYPPGFLAGFWTTALVCFVYQRAINAEVKLDGDLNDEIAKLAEIERYGDPIARMIDDMGGVSGALGGFVMPEAEDVDKLVTHLTTAAYPPNNAADGRKGGASSYQSCGEGSCCGASGFEPYSGLNNMSYYTAAGDLTDTLLQTSAHFGKKSRKLGQSQTMIRGPKTINTFSHYYADLPRAERSLFVSNPMDQDLRPSPLAMRVHKIGPYAENATYYRPSQDRAQVMETE